MHTQQTKPMSHRKMPTTLRCTKAGCRGILTKDLARSMPARGEPVVELRCPKCDAITKVNYSSRLL